MLDYRCSERKSVSQRILPESDPNPGNSLVALSQSVGEYLFLILT